MSTSMSASNITHRLGQIVVLDFLYVATAGDDTPSGLFHQHRKHISTYLIYYHLHHQVSYRSLPYQEHCLYSWSLCREDGFSSCTYVYLLRNLMPLKGGSHQTNRLVWIKKLFICLYPFCIQLVYSESTPWPCPV